MISVLPKPGPRCKTLRRSPANPWVRMRGAIYRGRWPLWVIVGLALAATFAVPPHTLERADQAPIKLCPFRTLTGLPDAGCGMTRSLEAVAHGQFRHAVRFHLLGPLVFGLLALWWLVGLGEVVRGKPWNPPWRQTVEMGVVYVVGSGLIVFGIWRLAHIASTGGLEAAWREGLLARAIRLPSGD